MIVDRSYEKKAREPQSNATPWWSAHWKRVRRKARRALSKLAVERARSEE
ncbi:MAG: hypothetical protein QUS11_06540 [Candidatus Fermentibacter sp.]|nr:hypothetical protein [Candidatus Fermentibacter sp.]